MKLSKEDIEFLYQLLDQLNVRGEENKAKVLELMQKLRALSDD